MNTLWIIFWVAMGACIGSFLNVLIYRLPRGESIVFPGSHCPRCGRAIRWYDNIPLLSWLVLGGRCRDCKTPISPRYLVIEAATAIRVAGLFVCYYVLRLREGGGDFLQSWPMFVAHASLLCGLLVCSVVDIELYTIPLEVTWFCAAVGVAAATVVPAFMPATLAHPLMPTVSPTVAAMSLGAVVGLAGAIAMLYWGFIQPSFVDAVEPPPPAAADEPRRQKSAGKASAAKSEEPPSRPLGQRIWLAPKIVLGIASAATLGYIPPANKDPAVTHGVVMTAECGVNPRKEILRELLFLLPAIVLAAAAALVLATCPAANAAWSRLFDASAHPSLAPHLAGLAASIFGYLVGGMWIWGTRILGTLAFGKEAMGMGDVHILAAVGAVTGWIVPSLAFFVAPIIGLAWALYLWIGKKQAFLAYGPWLAAGSLGVMLFHDKALALLGPLGAMLR